MSRLGAGMPGKAMAKASLASIDSRLVGDLTFQYNPAEFSLSKGTEWTNPGVRLERQWARPTYNRTNPAKISMEILFDAFPELFGDVTGDVQTLLNWTKPGPRDASGIERPPLLQFRWGASQAVLGMYFYLESVEVKYTLFRADGTPIRATCGISLVEATNPASRQNPTSGGRAGLESHVITEGETLHAIAWARFGDPTFWRAIADFNRIDDPLRLVPGTRLLIPPRRAIAGLA